MGYTVISPWRQVLMGDPASLCRDGRQKRSRPSAADWTIWLAWFGEQGVSGPAGSNAPAAPRRACLARGRGRACLARPPSCQHPCTQALCLRAPLCAQTRLSFLGPAPTTCKHIARHSLSAGLGEQPDNPQLSQRRVPSLRPLARARRNPVHGQAVSRAARHGHASYGAPKPGRSLRAASLHECCCLHTPGSAGITRRQALACATRCLHGPLRWPSRSFPHSALLAPDRGLMIVTLPVSGSQE
jgi:hypothetical protein